jgi:hypothetical protein
MPVPVNIESLLLANGVTISDYRRMETAGDAAAVAAFLRQRFEERYLRPLVDVDPGRKSGFAMVAVGCLMIEALESLRLGYRHSDGQSRRIFRSFFRHWEPFAAFAPLADDFFENVRCGILHQAETTGGWRIRRQGPLLDAEGKILNATRFLSTLRTVLRRYCDQLDAAPWESEIWGNARRKLDATCRAALGTAAE